MSPNQIHCPGDSNIYLPGLLLTGNPLLFTQSVGPFPAGQARGPAEKSPQLWKQFILPFMDVRSVLRLGHPPRRKLDPPLAGAEQGTRPLLDSPLINPQTKIWGQFDPESLINAGFL